MPKRCFVAININDSLKKRFIPYLKELRDIGVRTIPPKNLHITLKFLGDLKEDKIHKTIEALSKIEFSPFKIKFFGIGSFPNKEYVKVIWAGCESSKLISFASKVDESLSSIYSKDDFSAHLTLGRISKKLKLEKFFSKYKNKSFGSFEAESFELMVSELSNTGPKYSILWSSRKL